MQKTKEIQQELEQYIDPVKREYLPNFFKTGKGQYGEGDKFLGIVVPNTRIVAKRHKDVPFEVMAELLQSEWHECRLCALLMLVERFKKCDERVKRDIRLLFVADCPYQQLGSGRLICSGYCGRISQG